MVLDRKDCGHVRNGSLPAPARLGPPVKPVNASLLYALRLTIIAQAAGLVVA
ncbi:hypothetical protein ACFSTC_29845 [Nonomuraea ferruginea]